MLQGPFSFLWKRKTPRRVWMCEEQQHVLWRKGGERKEERNEVKTSRERRKKSATLGARRKEMVCGRHNRARSALVIVATNSRDSVCV